MRTIHYLDDARTQRVILNTHDDERLFEIGDREGTGRDSTRGTVLYLHVSKQQQKKTYFKFLWTRWQGEENEIMAISEDEARRFAEESLSNLDKEETKRLVELGLLTLEDTI